MAVTSLLLGLLTLSIIALQSSAQFDDSEESAVSLGGAPVGLYSKSRGPYGDEENAASLGGAPIGLYNKRRESPRAPRPYYRIPYRKPYPIYPAYQPIYKPPIYPAYIEETLDSGRRCRYPPCYCRGRWCRRRRPCRGRFCDFPDYDG